MRENAVYRQVRVREGRALSSLLVRRDPTQDELRQRLAYDPDTGIFYHRKTVGKGRAGEAAGGIDGQGYVSIRLFNRLHKAHRLAWLYMTGEWPPVDRTIDHRNGVRNDNRWANLRLADEFQQAWNTPAYQNSQSQLKGAWPCKTTGRWQAIITTKGKRVWLGRFDTAQEAADAFQRAEAEQRGEFRRVA